MSRTRLLALLSGAAASLVLAFGALAQDDAPGPTPTATPSASAPSVATPAEALVGSWDLRIEGTTIFRFAIERSPRGGWQGRWLRPESFNSNGDAFANLRGPVKTTASMTGNALFELVELAFDDPRPGAVPDIFRFRLVGPDAVEMTYVGTDLAPYRLVRAAASDALGNWDAGRVYQRPVPGVRPATGAGAAGPATPVVAAASPPPRSAARPAPDPAPAPTGAEASSRVIRPDTEGRIILGPQVPFLDLTPRAAEAAAEEPAVEELEAGSAAPPPADEPAPTPAPAASPVATPDEPRITADFLDGL